MCTHSKSCLSAQGERIQHAEHCQCYGGAVHAAQSRFSEPDPVHAGDGRCDGHSADARATGGRDGHAGGCAAWQCGL